MSSNDIGFSDSDIMKTKEIKNLCKSMQVKDKIVAQNFRTFIVHTDHMNTA